MNVTDRSTRGATPLTVEEVVHASVSYDELRGCASGLAWLERRPEDQGRTTVVHWSPAAGVVDVTPHGFDVGSAAHAYGGGVYAQSADGSWFVVNAADSSMYAVERPGLPAVALREGPGSGYCGDLVAEGGSVVCVQEAVSPTAEGDSLVQIARDGAETTLIRDVFLSSPAPHPDGGRIAWIRWGGTSMPWDATELKVASRGADGAIESAVTVAGGKGESVLEPRWGPHGDLYFVSDRSGWWNLYRWDGETVHTAVHVPAECAAAPWELGYQSYAFLPGGRIAYLHREGSAVRLAVAEPTGASRILNLPFTSLKPYLATFEGRIAAICASQTQSPAVLLIDPDSPEAFEVLARASTPTDRPLSIAGRLTVTGENQEHLHVLLYPPSDAADLAEDWSAPLILRVHPGPTDQTNERLDWRTQFFTSRGFAVAEVDYRGSTGYGRAFRESLYGRWGEYDVADCELVARHLISTGRTERGKVFISGDSAGSYTALKAVSQASTVFSAAVAGMTIADPVRWADGVSRFQRAHAQRLAGLAGPVVASEIKRPVLLLHGAKDLVAPLRDAERLEKEMRAHGKEVELVVFEEAGHSFSAGPVAAAVLHAELLMFSRLLGP
jgi:dipeptidyl aminopeptidase/acylaminoacyl peptidase